jgi:hypothetical protein
MMGKGHFLMKKAKLRISQENKQLLDLFSWKNGQMSKNMKNDDKGSSHNKKRPRWIKNQGKKQLLIF